MLEKLKSALNPQNMMFKLVVLNCGILLFVIVILTATGNVIYQNSIEEHSFANTAEIQNQVQKSLALIFQSVSDNLEILGKNTAVQEYLLVDEENDQANRVSLETQVRDLFLRYSRNYTDYLNLVLVSEKGQYLSNDSYRIQKTPLSRESWYQQAMAAQGALVLDNVSFGRNLKSWKNYSTDSYMTAVKMVADETTGKPVGVILLDLDLQSIQNLVEDITLGQTGFGYIQDSTGKVLYSPKNKIVYRMNPEWFEGSNSGSVRCKIEGKDYHVIYTKSKDTGLVAVGVFDWDKTIEGVSQVRQASVLIAVVVTILAIMCSIAFAVSFTKPISTLSKLMKRAQTGDLTVHFNNHYKGEIRQLGDAFNAMVNKINQLIGLVYKEQKDKREAELKILHEQVKPHFLYNTLDTIQWMAKNYHAADIVDIVRALSDFFRISLSQGKEYIRLEQEVEMVRSYLDIQKYRYEDLIEYECDFPSELMRCEVLKLCLQPLVENAIYHGLKESDREKGTIWMKGKRESSDVLLITVEDDGAGMTQERMEQLNDWMEHKDCRPDTDEDIDRGTEKGIAQGVVRDAADNGVRAFGTLNVNDRIKMAYGEKFGLHFVMRPEGGTIAELRIKINI